MDKDSSIPFDQFQRYGLAYRAIELLRGSSKDSLSILEVGANAHKLLKCMLPEDKITFLDCEFPEEMLGAPDVILGDATQLTLPDGAYDVVVALDVLEHITPEKRFDFLHEINRVARMATVLCAPFRGGEVEQAEKEARSHWELLFGDSYRWLAEHQECGLPDLDEVARYFDERGLCYRMLHHGEIHLWSDLIKSHFSKEYVEDLRPLVAQMDAYYNETLFENDFSSRGNCYRSFIFIFKKKDLVCRLNKLYRMSDNHSPSKVSIRLISKISSASVAIAKNFKSLQEAITERDGQIAELNQAVAGRDGQIAGLNQAVAERDAQIAGLNQAAAERDVQLAALNQAVAERDGQIDGMRGSRSWRLTTPYRLIGQQVKRLKIALRLAPRLVQHGGGIFNMAFKALKILRGEGWPGVKQRLRAVQNSANRPAIVTAEGKSVGRNDYTEWIRRYDTLTDEARSRMRGRIEELTYKPLISVIMPTYNPNREWLVEAVESVRAQIYPNWELCVADDASTDPGVRPLLEKYASRDPRIKIIFREQNGHISEASNSAMDLAGGDWTALLDHDDMLAEQALFRVVEAINNHPDAQLFYSDEDKIDSLGNRAKPYFKCDWNQDLFLSHNLLTHLAVYRTDLVRSVGGFRQGVEGAQDYDLAMRCVEQIEPVQIVHIPRILYHWREHSGSTAQDADAKPYAMLAGERVLNDHFRRTGVDARAELQGIGYRVRFALPDPAPMVSLIIPTRNGVDLVRRCVESVLERTRYPDYEILIVDNGSDDFETLGYFREIEASARVRVITDPRQFNYSALNNTAVEMAKGEIVGLLNNDTEVISADWLEEMASLALQPGVGAVGGRLWYPDDTLQHGGIILGIGGWAGHAHKGLPMHSPGYAGRAILLQGVSAVSGACLVVRKDLYVTLGGLNEENLKVACNDVDFCLRLREQGYRNIWTPYAELYHHESATRGYEDTPEKQVRFMGEVAWMRKRWGELFENDPAYSPNLTLSHEDFSLAWPPRLEFLQSAYKSAKLTHL